MNNHHQSWAGPIENKCISTSSCWLSFTNSGNTNTIKTNHTKPSHTICYYSRTEKTILLWDGRAHTKGDDHHGHGARETSLQCIIIRWTLDQDARTGITYTHTHTLVTPGNRYHTIYKFRKNTIKRLGAVLCEFRSIRTQTLCMRIYL